MTAVAQQTDEIGRVALELLERQFQHGDDVKLDNLQIHQHVVGDVKLIERQSVISVSCSNVR